MVEFTKATPEITAPPNFLGYSRGGGEDASLGTLFKGIGDAFTQAVTGVDNTVKEIIKADAYKSVDAEREAHETVLEAGTEVSQGRKLDVLSGDPFVVPDALKNVERYATNLKNSVRMGRISDTYYKAQVDRIAQRLRSQYPGYREYIDQTMSRATGFDVANAYARSLLSDLQSAYTSKKSQMDKDFDKAVSVMDNPAVARLPGAQAMINNLFANRGNPNVLQATLNWLADAQKDIAENEAAKRQAELMKSRNEVVHDTARRFAENTASNIIKRSVTATNTVAGIGGDIFKKVTDARLGGEMSPIEARKLAMGVRQLIDASYNEYLRTMTSSEDGAPMMPNLKEGSKEMNEIWNQNKQILVNLAEALDNKNMPLAATYAQMITDQTDIVKRNLMTNKDTAEHAIKLEILKSYPEGTQAVLGPLLKSEAPEKFHGVIQKSVTDMLTPPQNNKPKATIKNKIEELSDQKGINDLRVKMSLTKVVDIFTKPGVEDEVKVEAAIAAFSQGNKGVLDLFPVDTTINGKQVPGKTSAFKKMTSPLVAAEMRRLNELRPGLWNMYSEWTLDAYTNAIYSRDIADLGDMLKDKFLTFTWNDENNEFSVSANYNQPREGLQRDPQNIRIREERAKAIVQQFNTNFRSVDNILREEGEQRTEAFLAQLLRQEGLDNKMLQALLSLKPKKEEEK